MTLDFSTREPLILNSLQQPIHTYISNNRYEFPNKQMYISFAVSSPEIEIEPSSLPLNFTIFFSLPKLRILITLEKQ